jgi:hypothetical protein
MPKRIFGHRMDRVSFRSIRGQFAVHVFALSCAGSLICLLAGCGKTQNETQIYKASKPPAADAHISSGVESSSPSPFSLSIVSGTNNSITMSKRTEWAHEFYVVLTNISKEPQPVFEYWNGWGFQAISFELTTADAKRFVLTVKDRGFDKNFPSTFVVAPNEHQVFPIRLDESWQVQPALTVADGIPITLKAVYQVKRTRESTREHVWTGRVESHSYSLSLWQD